MNQSEPVFPSFRSAYLWAKAGNSKPMMIAPSTELAVDLKDSDTHRFKAWKLFNAIDKLVIGGGWSLLAIPNNANNFSNVSALTYDKQKDWLISISSKNNFEELDTSTFNYGIKVSDEPAKNMVASLGDIYSSYGNTKEDDFNLWYDDDGDFLYGSDEGLIKDTIKSFLSDIGDDTNIFLVKVNLPTDTNIKAINWFFKAFRMLQ